MTTHPAPTTAPVPKDQLLGLLFGLALLEQKFTPQQAAGHVRTALDVDRLIDDSRARVEATRAEIAAHTAEWRARLTAGQANGEHQTAP